MPHKLLLLLRQLYLYTYNNKIVHYYRAKTRSGPRKCFWRSVLDTARFVSDERLNAPNLPWHSHVHCTLQQLQARILKTTTNPPHDRQDLQRLDSRIPKSLLETLPKPGVIPRFQLQEISNIFQLQGFHPFPTAARKFPFYFQVVCLQTPGCNNGEASTSLPAARQLKSGNLSFEPSA